MDAAQLRLILIIVGVAFLVGLFLWERRRAAWLDAGDDDREEDWDTDSSDRSMHGSADASGRTAGNLRMEPNLGVWESEPPDDTDRPAPPPAASFASAEATTDSSLAGAAPTTGPIGAGPAADEPDIDDSDAAANELLIQIHVVNTGVPFTGEDILEAAAHCRLTLGDWDIFHRFASEDGDHEPLFSMANLVKPGSFPVEVMEDFETPGLALFAQFSGDPGDLMVFDEMVQAARRLAEELGGELEERGRTPLSVERMRILRGQVLGLIDPQRGARGVE
ncbi:hypothetical protein F2Q65_11160 [Thiohalocapsa marina]|uniref:Cell division protein ZipA n=1 Tax=Thiohalocapsa marina TaxID=424902 RepID=A0A5M8FNE1_9GAMM|nr:cell division protein ZipA C-terminal FtsZ-binding domain-containing protein [Thiohalocapsa marina]KAA6184661.1 hypothetical protein F2Q65_11160 [Thiohalocapsa marina]